MVNFKLLNKKIKKAKCLAKKVLSFSFSDKTKDTEELKNSYESVNERQEAAFNQKISVEVIDHRLQVEYETGGICLAAKDSTWVGGGAHLTGDPAKNPLGLLFPEAEILDSQEFSTTAITKLLAGKTADFRNFEMSSEADIYDDEDEEDKRAMHIKRRKKKSDVKVFPFGVSSCSVVENNGIINNGNGNDKVNKRPSSRLKQSQQSDLTMVKSQRRAQTTNDEKRSRYNEEEDADDEALGISDSSLKMPTPSADASVPNNLNMSLRNDDKTNAKNNKKRKS